jgi:hypothetical protein
MAYSRTLNHFTSMQELATIWASSTSYLVNQPVIHNNFLYRCAVAHTSSGSFQTDLAAGQWERVSSAENAINWASGAYYVLNQLVIDNDKLYKCLVAHTSGGSFIADLQSAYWVEISASEAGVFNYIENADAEVDTLGWSTYADAAGAQPVDGTGGSPNITFTRSTSSPLRGDADFNLAKDAVNRQGEGVAYDFTVDNADLAKVLTIAFDYEVVSGTYLDGDLTIYLIQDPSGTPLVIQPAGYVIQAGTIGTKLKAIATFQTASNVNDYRLCFHVASTSASAYTLAIDNVVVGPQVVQYGAPVTDWQVYTPIITATTTNPTLPTGGLSKNRAIWRRVGGSLEVHYEFETNSPTGGNNGSGTYFFSLPPGLNYDTSKLAGSIVTYGVAVGQARFSTRDAIAYLSPNAGTGVFGIAYEDAGTTMAGLTQAQALMTASNGISAHLTVPILGWSSTVQMSNDTDTRVVAATLSRPTSQTVSTSSETKVQLNSADVDTHNTADVSTNYRWITPVPGFYEISASVSCSSYNAGESGFARVKVNGNIQIASLVSAAGTSNVITIPSKVIALNAGDFVELFVQSGGDTSFTVGGSSATTWLSIKRLSGPSAIAASETVACKYTNTAGTALTSSFDVKPFPTKIFDTHGAYNTSTGVWTCPVSGKYRAYLRCSSVAINFGTTSAITVGIRKNNTDVAALLRYGNASSILQNENVTTTVDLIAGDTISFVVRTTSSTTMSLDPERNEIHIERIGN